MKIKYIIPKLVSTFIAVVLLSQGFSTVDASAAKREPNTVNGISLKRNNKTLYIDGCKGKTADGTKARLFSFVNVAKYYKGFDENTMSLRMESVDDTITRLNEKKHRIYARNIGDALVKTQIVDKETGNVLYNAPFYITVKKNVDPDEFTVEGLKDGETVNISEVLKVSFPKEDTDQRTLLCDDESVLIKHISANPDIFEVSFTESGDFTFVAAAYQSKKFPAYTASETFDVRVTCGETTIRQTGLKSFEIVGDSVGEEVDTSEIHVYEKVSGVDVVYSNIDDIVVHGDTASVKVFKPLVGNRTYSVDYAGEHLEFTSSGTEEKDVESIALNIENVFTGEKKEFTLAYMNAAGIDISDMVRSTLDPKVMLTIDDNDYQTGFLSGNSIIMLKKDEPLKVKATLEFQDTGKVLTAETTVVAAEKEAPKYTGTILYSFSSDDGKYLSSSDVCTHNIVNGDNVVFEALLLYSDGQYRTLKEAGITRVMFADERILMQKGRLFGAPGGGIYLETNGVGETGVVLYRGDEVVEALKVSVLEKRHPERMDVSLSKDKLNTNLAVNDYLVVKADVYDQYGAIYDAGPISIEQKPENKKVAGVAAFSSFVKGRLVIYGYDCIMSGKSDVIKATVSCGDFSEEISFTAKDISFDESKSSEYDIALKQQGPSIIDSALLKKDEEPGNILFTAEVKQNGYFTSEMSPILLKKKPNISQKASEFGIKDGESTCGLLVEFKPDKKEGDSAEKEGIISEETDCIISSYMGLEFWAYQYGSSLETGTYTVTLYYITCGKPYTTLRQCGESVSFRVVDTAPEIVVDQIAESAEISGSASWVTNIKKYFKFYLEGEDITRYVTNVNCNESADGTVYVKSVDFSIPNRYYGEFTKTAEVDLLITKQ